MFDIFYSNLIDLSVLYIDVAIDCLATFSILHLSEIVSGYIKNPRI